MYPDAGFSTRGSVAGSRKPVHAVPALPSTGMRPSPLERMGILPDIA